MSKLFRTLAMAAAVGLGAAAPAPIEPSRVAGFTDLYAPKARSKDYELRMAAYRGDAVRTEIILRRQGAWALVERKEGEGRLTQQVHLPTGVTVERSDTPGGFGSLGIRAPDPQPSPGIDYTSRPTKRSWKAAGQRCRIWEVYRGVEGSYTTFTRFGCVTSDGIEVARWTSGRSGADLGERVTGYYLLRRKMDEANVRPAGAVVDLSAWLSAKPTAAKASADDEVVLKAEATSEMLTVRRHGGWTFTETVNADGSRDIFSDRDDGVTVSARIGAGGTPTSYIARRGPEPAASPEVRLTEPAQTILGQTCDWIDVMPETFDVGRHECRTADGLVLAVRKTARGSQTTLTAVSVSRRPLADADLLPPAWMLDLRRWGVTD